MSTTEIASHVPLRSFIESQIISPGLSFNRSRDGGSHSGLICDSARAHGLEVVDCEGGSYFFSSERCVGGVRKMAPTLTGLVGAQVATSKVATKTLLEKAGVATPKWDSMLLDAQGYRAAADFLKSVPGSIVVKPSGGRGGAGVVTDISNVTNLKSAWSQLRAKMSPKTVVLVEEQKRGVDVRVYVVEGSSVASSTRIQPFVIGDGVSPLGSLIQSQRDTRSRNAYLNRMPIVVDEHLLRRSRWEISTVPDKDQVVILNDVSNMHLGGTNVDMTDTLHPGLRRLAERAMLAIPGLACGGVDLLVEDPRADDSPVVLEVNPGANILVHHRPGYGESRDVATALVSAMLSRASLRR